MCGPSVHPTEGRQSNKPGQGRRRSRPDVPRCRRPTEQVSCFMRSRVGTHRSGALYPRDALFKGATSKNFRSRKHRSGTHQPCIVNYDPEATDLFFIRVNIYLVPGEGGLQLFYLPFYFIRVATTLPYNNYLPRVAGGGSLQLIFQPINYSRVPIYFAAAPTILAEVTRFTALFWLFWLASMPLFTLGP
jgi:hypothetical protein